MRRIGRSGSGRQTRCSRGETDRAEAHSGNRVGGNGDGRACLGHRCPDADAIPAGSGRCLRRGSPPACLRCAGGASLRSSRKVCRVCLRRRVCLWGGDRASAAARRSRRSVVRLRSGRRRCADRYVRRCGGGTCLAPLGCVGSSNPGLTLVGLAHPKTGAYSRSAACVPTTGGCASSPPPEAQPFIG